MGVGGTVVDGVVVGGVVGVVVGVGVPPDPELPELDGGAVVDGVVSGGVLDVGVVDVELDEWLSLAGLVAGWVLDEWVEVWPDPCDCGAAYTIFGEAAGGLFGARATSTPVKAPPMVMPMRRLPTAPPAMTPPKTHRLSWRTSFSMRSEKRVKPVGRE